MTTPTPRYKIATTMIQICGLLGVDMHRVIRRSGLPATLLDEDARGVTAQDYYAGWSALVEEANMPDLPLVLGQAYARGPFNPAFFAFTCSATVRAGLERLAVFKPIVGPLIMSLRNSSQGLQIVKSANPATIPLPVTFSATEMVFFIEATRNATAQPVVPKSITLAARLPCHAALEAFFRTEVQIGARSEMTLHARDADLPLLSRNPEQWATMEPTFLRDLAKVNQDLDPSTRVRYLLMEMLPSGLSNMTEAAARLRLSTRSLQRQLAEDGQSFQLILEQTRHDLALHYLRETPLNTEEISYLLAYRDPNSFYRAFQSWTGMTPKEARLSA